VGLRARPFAVGRLPRVAWTIEYGHVRAKWLRKG
jgi:hypothetical protein